MNQLAQSETDGSAHADARRTYEKLVALLNSNGTQSLAEGRHDEELPRWMSRRLVTTYSTAFEERFDVERLQNTRTGEEPTQEVQVVGTTKAPNPNVVSAGPSESELAQVVGTAKAPNPNKEVTGLLGLGVCHVEAARPD